MGWHFLLEGILPTQGWNPGLSHCRQTLYHLHHQGSPGQFTPILCRPTPTARLNGPRMLWGPVSFRGHFISYICAIYISVPRFSPLIPQTEHADGGWGSGEVKSLSRARLCDPMDSSLHQAPPSMGFSRQEYWSGLPFPSPGNLPNPGIEPRSLTL